jgi:hypothetical protein
MAGLDPRGGVIEAASALPQPAKNGNVALPLPLESLNLDSRESERRRGFLVSFRYLWVTVDVVFQSSRID